ncbi:MAG: hypothetical protein A3K61_06745 [Thaumarchaeota archaeon RBG_16_49_8]|nr:MAG: hypothetical protein A3K61_06745 [Thaumarchaeota archaeon RBG_16_49_8]
MPNKAAAIGLISILLLQMVGFIAIPTASAQERYTSLTYSGLTSFKIERELLGFYRPIDARIIVTSDLIFDITLSNPDEYGDMRGTAMAKGTFSGTITDYGYGCKEGGTGTVSGTYTETVSVSAHVAENTVDLFVRSVDNYVETKSEIPKGCWNGKTGSGASNIKNYIENFLYDCFNTGTQYTYGECGEFPVSGGNRTINRRANEYFKSVSGTAQFTLLDSKKEDPFDFGISVAPAEIKVYKGGTATYAVSVSTIKGKAAQVTLSAPIIEGLGRFALDRTTGTPPFDAKLTVLAGEAKAGKYTFQITGTAGNASKKSEVVTLVVENCPIFTITPTMPVANDPREFASPNGKASFRFDVEWNGKLPVSIGLNAVAAGGGVIQPSFAFNPVQLLNSKVNIIMEVTTINAGKGNYPIVVTATINDPELPNSCSTTAPAAVTLVVGESRPQDFPLIIRPIQVINQQGKVAVQGKQIETQNDGKMKVAITKGTIDIGNNTKVNIIRPNRTAEQSNRTTGSLINEILDPELDKEIMDELRGKSLKILEEAEKDRQRAAAQKDLIDVLACMFVFDPEIARSCLNYDVVYVDHGEVHVFDLSKEKRLQDIEIGNLIILAPDAVIIPKGTEFTLKLDSNGNTILTMIDGSVLYTQLSTQNVRLVNATQQLTAEIQQAAGGQSISDSVSSIDPKNIEQWWLQENRTTTSTTTSTTTTSITTNSTKTSSSTTSTTITSSANTTMTTTTNSQSTTTTTSSTSSSTTTFASTSTQAESTGTTAASQVMDFSVIGAIAVFAVAIVGVLVAVLLKRRK